MDAAQVVDLVDPAKALAWRSWIFWVVVGATNVNALCWADGCAQLAANALLHAVFVTVQYMAAMQALGLGNLFVHDFGALRRLACFRFADGLTANAAARILRGHLIFSATLTHGDEEASEVTH